MAGERRDGQLSVVARLVVGVAALPTAFIAATATATVIGVAARQSGVRPWDSLAASRVIVVLLVVVAGSVVGAAVKRAAAGSSAWRMTLPFVALLGYAVVGRFLSLGHRAEWFLGGDHVRHLLFVAEERVVGNLDYSTQPYPRAWHTLVTIIWSATGPRTDAAGLRSLIDLMSTATWCLAAVLSLATGALTVALAQRCGATSRQADLAGLAAASVMLLNPFLGNYQALGFETSYVGAIVLAVVAREVLVVDDASRVRAALVCIAALIVCAHSWQLLLPATGLAFLVVAWPVARRGGARDRLVLSVAALCGAVVTVPALLAVFTAVGVEHASDAGVVAPVPWALLGAGLLATGFVALRRPRSAPVAIALVVTVLPGLTGAWLAFRVGIPVTDYYPSKLLWHTAVLGLSPLAFVCGRGWAHLARRAPGGSARILRGAGAVVACLALAYALISPALAFMGAWSSVRGPVVVDAITSPGADNAQVVWLGDLGDDTIGRILLDFYRVPDPRRTLQSPLDVAEECTLLRAADRPTVLSNRTSAEVQSRYGCVPTVERVPVADALAGGGATS
ncbi:hypothetical protein GCM10009867_34950 [Pedococcus aerophilus]|uniref:Glycosyltransferase RgtA/B/C/D-like domain-containing protein n=1 Tax=Pedococcus aerophilus TaxID=436356 RepID=A0ABN3UX85_9MICO